MTAQVTAQIGSIPYQVTLSDSTHTWLADADQPETGNVGPGPHEMLLGSLGACTAITLSMYAQRKQLPLSAINVTLDITAEARGQTTQISRSIELHGELDEEQRKRLLQIANMCPIHQLLSGSVAIESTLIG
jgi:putative redox protein